MMTLGPAAAPSENDSFYDSLIGNDEEPASEKQWSGVNADLPRSLEDCLNMCANTVLTIHEESAAAWSAWLLVDGSAASHTHVTPHQIRIGLVCMAARSWLICQPHARHLPIRPMTNMLPLMLRI